MAWFFKRSSYSSYPSIFWLVGSFPSGIVANHSFHCYITSAPVFLAICFKYCSRGLPTALFPDIASSSMFTRNSLHLIVCPIHEWHLFFKIFKSNLSSFALWKTSSFVILSVHFIFNILLQHHVSNAFTILSSFFPRAPCFWSIKSNTPNTTKVLWWIHVERSYWILNEFSFSLRFFDTFLILRRIKRDIMINVYRSSCKVLIMLVRFLMMNFDRFFIKCIKFHEN